MKDYKELERAWGILHIAVYYPKYITPEQAEKLWETGEYSNIPNTSSTTKDILSFRENGMTYREIGETLGMKADAVYNRLRRYKGKI